MGESAAPSWTRWNVRKDFLLPGNQWHLTHDCGYTTTVDLGVNGLAAVEAERAHERNGCG